MDDTPTIRLQPRFLLLGTPIAWACTRCERIFSISTEEAMENRGDDPPDTIRAEFQQHDCGVVLFARLIEKHPGIEQVLRADPTE